MGNVILIVVEDMKCPECGKAMSSDVALSIHRKNAHGVEPPSDLDTPDPDTRGWQLGCLAVLLVSVGMALMSVVWFIPDLSTSARVASTILGVILLTAPFFANKLAQKLYE